MCIVFWKFWNEVFFRVSPKDTKIEKFDASCNHEHEEEVNHLKVSLIQERNDSSDVIGQKFLM